MRILLLFPLAVFGLFAQSDKPFSVSAGFMLGSPLNDPSGRNSLFTNYTQGRWTGGPTVELHLPYRFSVEFDALYRTNRSNYSSLFQFGPNVNAYNTSFFQKTNVWDLPLLLKHRFKVGPLRPFVSAGYFWSRESNESSSYYLCSGPQGSCRPSDYPGPDPRGGQYNSSTTLRGVAAATGIEFKTRFMTISPEMRFSRPTNGYLRDNRFTGLVGFTFKKKI